MNIYVRLPFYLAAYLRNLDGEHPVPDDAPCEFERGDEIYAMLLTRPIHNSKTRAGRGKVHSRCEPVWKDCFSHNQWEQMRRGRYINSKDKELRLDIHRDHDAPLSVGEIYMLSGQDALVKRDIQTLSLLPDSAYKHCYIALRLPKFIVSDRGSELSDKYSDWVLPCVDQLRKVLQARFRRSFVNYIAEFLSVNSINGITPTKQEALDRFMLRYGIRDDYLSRERLKKDEQRVAAAVKRQYAQDATADYEKYVRNRQELVTTTTPMPNKPRRILCYTNGTTYASIGAFARAIGASYNVVLRAVQRGQTSCHGFRFGCLDGRGGD